jgi:8-oxo-dGTP diphosphatase
MPEKLGCGILFFDRKEKKVLLFRRDNKEGIQFPGHLDILGGHVDAGETPEHAIVREMHEELLDQRTNRPYELKNFSLFKTVVTLGTTHSIYTKEADFKHRDLKLLEGQYFVWVSEEDVERETLAYEFNDVVLDFFRTHLQ